MSAHVSNAEVRRTLESVAATTKNQAVRRVMLRAMELLDNDRIAPAAAELLEEMARTKRAERTLLWLGPLAALVTIVVLFAALRGFWLGL